MNERKREHMATIEVHTVTGAKYVNKTEKSKEEALADTLDGLHHDGCLVFGKGWEEAVYIPHHAVSSIHVRGDDRVAVVMEESTHAYRTIRGEVETLCGVNWKDVSVSARMEYVDCPECIKRSPDGL